MASGTARVKQVISGDTIVIIGTPKGGPPPEKQLSLSSIAAPKVALKTLVHTTEDEPFGWESREYLRKLIIGKQVEFKVEYKLGEREFACIKFNGDCVGEMMVQQGLAQARPGKAPQCAANLDAITKAESAAKATKKGLWNEGDAIRREITWAFSDAELTRQFYNDNKHKKLKAIIEYVRDGACIRAIFTDSWFCCPILLSGINSDGFKREQIGQSGEYENKAETYAEETKFFVESRLLHRDVEIRLDGCDNGGDLYGSIYHPNGNIAVHLLKSGLVKFHDWSARFTESPVQLREALKEAQNKQIKRWKNYQAGDTSLKSYTGKVVEVVGGDCMIIEKKDSTEKIRVYLASIKCPRQGTKMKPEEPWSMESKEFCRKRLIGEYVSVCTEYTQIINQQTLPMGATGPPPSDSTGALHFVNIYVTPKANKSQKEIQSMAKFQKNHDNKEGKNKENKGDIQNAECMLSQDPRGECLTELLIQKGLAKTQMHRSEDDRASNFDKLLDLERIAKEAQVGLFGPEEKAPKHRINEILGSANAARARSFEAQLKRLAKIDGIVEYVFNAGRYKIRLPSENLAIAFCLSGVRAAQTERPGNNKQIKAAEPFSVEALEYAKMEYLQRSVQIVVSQCDRGGNFIGTMKRGKCNVASTLLELGFVSTVEFSLNMTPHKEEYLEAEKKAKESHIGIWSLPSYNIEEKATGISKDVNEPFAHGELSHINSIHNFYIQSSIQNVDNIMKLCNDIHVEDDPMNVYTSGGPPRKGELVLSVFTLDKKLYRAKVLGHASGAKFTVFYMDFGNTENVYIDTLRKCPQELAKIPAAAYPCALSGTAISKDYQQDASIYFNDICDGKAVKGTCEKIDEAKTRHIVLYLKEEAAVSGTMASSINEKIIHQGLAKLDKKSKTKIFDKLVKEEEYARRHHLNCWCYGDGGDDDEEFPAI